MKKLHIALSVSDIEQSVLDYSSRLSQEPDLVIPGEYALWRTDTLNISIRRVADEKPGKTTTPGLGESRRKSLYLYSGY